MKQILLFLLITSLVGCQKKEVVLPDLLYHRWQLVQIQEANSAPKTVAKTTFITFTADGKIRYDETGYDGSCCVPRRFDRQQQTLVLDYSTDQPEYCKYVDLLCTSVYSPGPRWGIEQVDNQVLWLLVGNKRLIHNRAD